MSRTYSRGVFGLDESLNEHNRIGKGVPPSLYTSKCTRMNDDLSITLHFKIEWFSITTFLCYRRPPGMHFVFHTNPPIDVI